MDKLFDAASRGNVEELHLLLRENPLILHYVTVESDENPLELACLCGHLDFARELLSLNPKFAKKLNRKGYSPLHMAAANGHVEIVQELTRFDPELCRLKGKDMRTALHSAILRGEIGVINEILIVCPECIEDVTIQGETALHLAVKSSQYESLQILVDWIRKMGKEEIINVHDEQNNTVLSLAMQMKERRALQLLLPIGNVEIQDRINHGCEYLASSAQHSTGTTSYDYFKFQKGRDSPSDARTALLVIAVLVATATYQVGLNPPGGTWLANNSMANNSSDPESYSTPIAGISIMGTYDDLSFIILIGLNSIGLSVSLSMIAMLTTRFPLRGELRICLITLYVTYGIAVNGMSPDRVRVISIVLTSVLPTSVPLLMYLMRKYLEPMMRPTGQSLIKYKVVRALADYYG